MRSRTLHMYTESCCNHHVVALAHIFGVRVSELRVTYCINNVNKQSVEVLGSYVALFEILQATKYVPCKGLCFFIEFSFLISPWLRYMMLCEVSKTSRINGCTKRTNGIISVSHITHSQGLRCPSCTSRLCHDDDRNRKIGGPFGACLRVLMGPLLMLQERTLEMDLAVILQLC
jgi:hypothetical protein